MEITEKHLNIPRQVVQHLSLKTDPDIGQDDLEQIGFLVLLEAAKRFDPTRGVLFATYAKQAITNRLMKYASKNNRVIINLDEVPDHRPTPEEAVLASIDGLCAGLKPKSINLLDLRYTQCHTLGSTAQRMGITVSQASRRQRRVIGHLKRRLDA